MGPGEGCFASKLAEVRGLIDPKKRGYLFYYTNRYLRYTSPCLERKFFRWKNPLYAYELLDKVIRGERSPYLFLLFVEPYGEELVRTVLVHRLFFSYVDKRNFCLLLSLLLEKYPALFADEKFYELLRLCGITS